MKRAHILLVGGDTDVRQMLAEQLYEPGLTDVVGYANAAEALAALAQHPADLCLIDAQLPDRTGESLGQLLRQGGMTGPILLLSPPSPQSSAIATEVILKPYRLGALLARLRHHLELWRQGLAEAAEGPLMLGPYRLDPAERLLTLGENKLRLTDKETALLAFLHGAPGQRASKETLLAEIWGYGPDLSTHTLETHIYRLRRKIATATSPGENWESELLLTEPGGYRLNG